ncbi:MAG TPA: hypothetical protein VKS22_07575 [Candidatus Binataceae bacterium]|nr:hypothetical protein [Candidatus Binataceae bacterium]
MAVEEPKIDDNVADGAAADGARLGYAVIEKHIRQARAIAAQYEKDRTGKKSMPRNEDVTQMLARIFRSLSDLTPVVGELFNNLGAQNFTQILGAMNPTGAIANSNGFVPAAARVVIGVSSKRYAAVSCELRAAAERLRLMTRGLEGGNGRVRAVTAVTFAPAKGGKPARLQIRIPDEQPAGVYCGLLVERVSGEPQGVVSVRIGR